MYKLTVTSSEDGVKREFMRIKNVIAGFRDPALFPKEDPEMYESYTAVYGDLGAISAIVQEALDQGDAAQLEKIK